MNPADDKAPEVKHVPVGLYLLGERQESDSLGSVVVPADQYWGAQTQRALTHFDIGDERMPVEVVHAYGQVKKAAATVNTRRGLLPEWKGALIGRVSDEVAAGDLDESFPLSLWQSGSGTQTNMNVNEVVANRCIQLVGGKLGSKVPVHPNDDVNMSQSSNDTFVTAMHVAAYVATVDRVLPALERLGEALFHRSLEWGSVLKVGRTHLQDATPITVGQEWSGYAAALDDATDELEHATQGLLQLGLGGTAVGTGLNAPAGFADEAVREVAVLTGHAFTPADNTFAAQSTLDRMVRAHAALKAVAVTLFKVANDLRWLGSGPRAGLMEVTFPANEPGSSIMPGKLNPTQAEAMLMVCIQVMADDVAVQMAGAEGNFELNVFRPVVVGNFLRSARLMADVSDRFREYLVEGVRLNEVQLQRNVERSVMLATALSPVFGYEYAAVVARYAVEHDVSLRESALHHGVSEELYDELVDPLAMALRPDVGRPR